MTDDLKRLAEQADYNMRVERIRSGFQTALDEWTEQVELDVALMDAVRQVEIGNEPRRWSDVVSYGPAAVIGFLTSATSPKDSDECGVFS